ncbi:CapA family protein [Brevundimonas sp. 2YAF1]|uniref:CapA family protein n=3 Tax=unclassified Brevundimonas TaxID=2622653 RepID=UPI003F9210C6
MDRRGFLAAGAALALASPATGRPRPLRLSLLGQALIEHAPGAWPGREALAVRLARGDVVFTNLETVIQGLNAGAPTRELLTLHAAQPEVLSTLRSLHLGLIATANNHAFDLGPGGIRDTVDALRAAGLPSTGSGADLAAASAPAYASSAAGAVGLVAFATGKVRPGGAATADRPGVNELRRDAAGQPFAEDVERILHAIAAARRQAQVVIACQHNHDWEPDMAQVPDWQRALARRCIDAGAAVFAGHGAPLLQGIEFHQGAPLFYGLGNFVFQTEKPMGAYPPESWEGVIAECAFDGGRCREARLVPLTLNEVGLNGPNDMATRGLPALASAERSAAILNRIAVRSQGFGTSVDRRSGRIAPDHRPARR